MGITDAYEPIAGDIAGGDLTTSAARRLRLRYARRLEADVRRMTPAEMD